VAVGAAVNDPECTTYGFTISTAVYTANYSAFQQPQCSAQYSSQQATIIAAYARSNFTANGPSFDAA
jgi:hypothetical protein